MFGDSLSDNGNAAILQGGTVPGDYSPNAYTDGPNTSPPTSGPFGLWIDQFAALAGLPDPKPFLSTLPNNTNFAIASAQTGPGNPQDISNQVGSFLLSSVLLSTPAPSNALYAIWGGANDILDGTRTGVRAADNLYSDILNLAGDGAKYFIWLDVPALGDTPIGQGANASSFNAQSVGFDGEWAIDISKLQAAGIDVIGLDVYAEFKATEANPGAFGFTDVTNPAQNTTGNPNTYLFWDQEHPTTAADALPAQGAYDAVTSVPEPGSRAMLIFGMTSIAILIVRRRRLTEPHVLTQPAFAA